MSKLIYCNFESLQQANHAIDNLKKQYPGKMISFLIDNSYRYAENNIDNYVPQGIPTAVLNQLYGDDAPPQVTSATQTTQSLSQDEKSLHITTVKMSFTDDVPKEIISKITQLGGINIKTFLP